MALGVPVVASDIGGVREWLHDGVTGRLAAPKSAADLAAGARELLEPENNRRYGQNGQQLIREKFLPDQHITKLLAAYEAARQARS
jgi:glycosyltransferase involved in cell wall biosynthesis